LQKSVTPPSCTETLDRDAHEIKRTEIPHVPQYLDHKSLASTGAYLWVSDAEASAAVQSALSR